MQCVQAMHSNWRPLRMSMPVGQTATHSPQSTQSPVVLPSLPRGSPRRASYPITSVSESNSTPWKRA